MLVFLRANFAHGSPEPLRNAANRQTLAAPGRAQLLQARRGRTFDRSLDYEFRRTGQNARSVPVHP